MLTIVLSLQGYLICVQESEELHLITGVHTGKEDLHTQSGIKIDLQEPHYKYGDFVS